MKNYKIIATAEGIAKASFKLTEEQYQLIDSIFKKLNEVGEAYAPYLSIFEYEEKNDN